MLAQNGRIQISRFKPSAEPCTIITLANVGLEDRYQSKINSIKIKKEFSKRLAWTLQCSEEQRLAAMIHLYCWQSLSERSQ